MQLMASAGVRSTAAHMHTTEGMLVNLAGPQPRLRLVNGQSRCVLTVQAAQSSPGHTRMQLGGKKTQSQPQRNAWS